MLRRSVLLVLVAVGPVAGQDGPAKPPPVEYIDSHFENASPLWYEFAADGTVAVHLTYDHERGAPNRAAGHIHFKIEAKAGAKLTLEFKNIDNVYNGRPGSVAGEMKA